MRTASSSTVRATEATRCQHLEGYDPGGTVLERGYGLGGIVPVGYGPGVWVWRGYGPGEGNGPGYGPLPNYGKNDTL